MLDKKGRVKWEECFADGTFASAKKGRSGRHYQIYYAKHSVQIAYFLYFISEHKRKRSSPVGERAAKNTPEPIKLGRVDTIDFSGRIASKLSLGG